jgi:diguanylate cyclase (GGDEF)-like protein
LEYGKRSAGSTFADFDMRNRRTATQRLPVERNYSRVQRRRAWPAWITALVMMSGISHAQQFSFRPYALSEGLTNLAVGHLALGTNSDLWVGTDGGLFRYDGTSFEPMDIANGLPPDQVGGVQTDPWGGVWVNLVRGLYSRAPGNTQFAPLKIGSVNVHVDFRTPIGFLDSNHILALSEGRIIELARDRDQWRSVDYLSPSESARLNLLGPMRRLIIASDGTLWLSCGKWLCSVAHHVVREWRSADGVSEDDWNTFLEDREGRIWVRSPQHLLVRERGASAFTQRDPPLTELGEIRDNLAMVLDSNGRLLVRTGSGMARWDQTQWKAFTFANGLPSGSVSDALLDDEGNIWLGLNGLGLWRWRNYDHLESWTRAQGLVSDKIWSLFRDPQGRLLLGTSHGCEMLDEHASRVVKCPIRGLPSRPLRAMALDHANTLWWGFNNGEIWSSRAEDGEAHLVFPAAADRPEVSRLYFDQSGLGWVTALDGGLFQLDPRARQLEKVAMPGGRARMYDIAEDTVGRIWVAGSKGLLRKGAEGWSWFGAHDPAGNTTVFGSVAASPDGSVWGASDGKGLLRASASTFGDRTWVSADIVAHTSVYFVRTDARGWVWLGTDQGVIVFDGHLWRRIDQEDGLIWNDTQVYGFLADTDGSVWIGTSVGLTHIRDPEYLMRTPKPLELDVARARLGDMALAVHNRTVLPWRADAAFDVHLSSHSFSRSGQTEFRYRLIGLSSNWFGSRSPEIHLPALDAGEYRLEVMAVDAPHARTSKTETLRFEISPPWWRTPVFRVSIFALCVLLVSLAWRWQVVKLRVRRTALEAEFRERAALLERATRDALTGLWNRVTILDALARETTQAQRTGIPLWVGLIDVDHFKQVNDNHGHLGGDEVLRVLARRLSAQARQGDWLGRYGGEELLLVLPGMASAEAGAAAERLRKSIAEEPFNIGGHALEVTISIGLARCETPVEGPEQILARADAALYDAKRTGRNRICGLTGPDESDMTTGSRRHLRALLARVNTEGVQRSPTRASRE